MIKVDNNALEKIAAEIDELQSEAIQVALPLDASIGETAKAVEATYSCLNSLCREELPLLFSGSANLLRSISASFESADVQAAEMIEN